MKHLPEHLAALGPGPDVPEVVRVFVEIPKGSRNKYEIDEETGLLTLDRYLYASSHYPGDYGFVPRTLADDGDALDVLVVVSEPTFPGCLVRARVLGVFRMQDAGKTDHKILAVPASDPHLVDLRTLEDLRPPLLREIEHFFLTYKSLEGGEVVGDGWGGIEEAHEVVRRALREPPGPAP